MRISPVFDLSAGKKLLEADVEDGKLDQMTPTV
jgi:hypothetical protein